MSETRSTRKYAELFPDLGAGPIPLEPAISQHYFERERAAIFMHCWINVGRVEEIPERGDFVVRDLPMCRTSIVIVRDKNGTVRAFHNVCQHRGTQLVWHRKGHCKGAWACRFHGWVYDTSGRLVHITDEENFFGIDKANYGLRPVSTDVWRGFIFVNMEERPSQNLRDYIGKVGDELETYPFEEMPVCSTYIAKENANWKVQLDAQSEGYHVKYLHKNTIAVSFSEGDKGMAEFRSSEINFFGPHRRICTGPTPGFSPPPTAGLAAKFGPGSIDGFAGASAKGKGKNDALIGIFDFYVIFPNFVLGLMKGTYFTYNFWPSAVDQSDWEIRMYYPEPKNAGQLFSNEYGKVAFRDTLMEDASTHDRVQAGLMSGAIRHMLFQDEESLPRHNYKVVDEYVRGAHVKAAE